MTDGARTLALDAPGESRPRATDAPAASPAAAIWIGVDGGGTRSRALVGDQRGKVLGAADGGPGLIDPLRPGRAVESVAAVARAAAADAGAALPAQGLWAGLAGAGHDEARREVETGLRGEGVALQVVVGSDLRAAHADAFGDGPGILIVCGTGSALRAVAPGGQVIRVGGWGHLLGDEGSGYAIGLGGLRAVMRASDGRGPPTALSGALLGATGAASAADLVGWVARSSKGAIAALSVAVAEEARRGDPAACKVVESALEAVRAHLCAALARWPDRDGPPAVAFAGGLAGPGGAIAEAARKVAAELGCAVRPGPVVPERGALMEAARTAACTAAIKDLPEAGGR